MTARANTALADALATAADLQQAQQESQRQEELRQKEEETDRLAKQRQQERENQSLKFKIMDASTNVFQLSNVLETTKRLYCEDRTAAREYGSDL